MNDIVYRLSTQDICLFLTNKEHLSEVSRRVKKDFSCMEGLKYFIQSVEEQIYNEKKSSQLKVEVIQSNIKLYENNPLIKETGQELLRFETKKYVMEVLVESNELVNRYISFIIYSKHYYSETEYVSIFETTEDMEEKMEELNSKAFNVWDYYMVFAQFLTSDVELVMLWGFDYVLTVPESFLEEYIEEVDNPGDNYPTTLTDFLDMYTYVDTEEIQHEMDRKRIPYQRFEPKADK
ncbi:hypothetical protein [Enterococcus faecium]|uniref:hypothetical protein n=1 Tax=Enterococcus faecium TaxID=1352 RepID=UPI000BF1B64C|nr:hypothetical protein [Enterococcus faecium]PEH49501.1 hypothetical protein CRM75_01675 [Enterococcus faecium]